MTTEGVGPRRPPPPPPLQLTDQTLQRTKEDPKSPTLIPETPSTSISSSLITPVSTCLPIISKLPHHSFALGGGPSCGSGDTQQRQHILQQEPVKVYNTFISDNIDGSNIVMADKVCSTLSGSSDKSGCPSCIDGDITTSGTISGNKGSEKDNSNGSIVDVSDSVNIISENDWAKDKVIVVSGGSGGDVDCGAGGSGVAARDGKEETGRFRLLHQETGSNDEEVIDLGSSRGGKRSITSVDEAGEYGVIKDHSRDNKGKDDEIQEGYEDGSNLHLVLPAPKFSKIKI
ncbi:unnamed protein product [Ambrosiozyma monospora]|uniref:Unnamed protein product n=1 Tax=Ambrosiozyma monospora TaxID=43982 RepID=A0ACB5U6F7_AMBMO|nr:unnamed protein product [Ambrosiozyma monospora]